MIKKRGVDENDMKILFLDIDGVLMSGDYLHQEVAAGRSSIPSNMVLPEDKILMLKEIIEATGAEIVLSSTWRIHDDIFINLQRQLYKHEMRIYHWTGPCRHTRADEIREWLNGKSVAKFCILDDCPEMAEFTTTNLVRTYWDYGLQQEHVQLAIDVLNKEII